MGLEEVECEESTGFIWLRTGVLWWALMNRVIMDWVM
jgi:hypothetical protein